MTIDSNILIAYLNGERKVVDTLREWNEEGRTLFISSVTLPISRRQKRFLMGSSPFRLMMASQRLPLFCDAYTVSRFLMRPSRQPRSSTAFLSSRAIKIFASSKKCKSSRYKVGNYSFHDSVSCVSLFLFSCSWTSGADRSAVLFCLDPSSRAEHTTGQVPIARE